MSQADGFRVDDRDFLPISDYAVIGDCRTAALVGRNGSCDWLCLPHFSSPSVFARLLDPQRGGHFQVCPAGEYRVSRRYVQDTNVLKTTFTTDSGVLEVTDLMPVYPRDRPDRFMQPERELLRILEVLDGTVEIEISVAPRPNYGADAVQWRPRGRLGWACEHHNGLYFLHTDMPLDQPAPDRLTAGIRLGPGDRRHLSFTFSTDVGVIPTLGEDAARRLEVTVRWWQTWASHCSYEGPYRDAVVRSALTLKLLTYTLSGALVAAPTTSLPEDPGGSRNWDYRYCWLRDASLTLLAFGDLGYTDESRAFLGWLLHATRLTRPALQVLYDVFGEAKIHENQLLHLSGYRNSRPVRIGNGAWEQLQLDVYGEFASAAYDYIQRGGRLDRYERHVLAGFGNVVCRRWQDPDEGIWEFRGSPRHNTHSKLMCWVALDRLLALDEQGHLKVPRDKFITNRDAIREAIEERGFNRDLDSYVGVLDGDYLDSSLLLMPHFGFISADAPRMRSTAEQIQRHLEANGLTYRYPPGVDNLSGREATFGVCSFWLVEYLCQAGRYEKAKKRFEYLLSLSNDVGLYAEQIEPATGAAVGNFPQAFSHVGVITAALALAAANHRRRGVERV